MSRVEIAGHVWRRVRWARRAYLEIVTADGLCIYGVHLSAVHSNLTEQRRAYEIRALLRSVERHQHGLHVVTGDFNTLAPGERLEMSKLPPRLRALAWVTGKSIRWITIRMMLEAGSSTPTGSSTTTKATRFLRGSAACASTTRSCRNPSRARSGAATLRDHPSLKLASDHFPIVFEIQR
jgi:hypothetical protein